MKFWCCHATFAKFSTMFLTRGAQSFKCTRLRATLDALKSCGLAGCKQLCSNFSPKTSRCLIISVILFFLFLTVETVLNLITSIFGAKVVEGRKNFCVGFTLCSSAFGHYKFISHITHFLPHCFRI